LFPVGEKGVNSGPGKREKYARNSQSAKPKELTISAAVKRLGRGENRKIFSPSRGGSGIGKMFKEGWQQDWEMGS